MQITHTLSCNTHKIISEVNIMFTKTYKNFVKASSHDICPVIEKIQSHISGEEARRLYLEEVKDARTYKPKTNKFDISEKRRKVVENEEEVPLTNKDLFITIQNNDVDKLIHVLDKHPDKINTVDDYGWSLLMIACQANAIDSVKELLRRGVDMSVRDKAGNSARSLVIKNKNYALAELLLNKIREKESKPSSSHEKSKTELATEYKCEICNKTFPDREEHLSSTLHNISASKGKKMPTNYVIPASNIGYQLMLKGGWDRDSGLGRDGSGKKYPIKAVQKKDRKGLGHGKRKKEEESPKESIQKQSRKMFENNYKNNRQFEINFRREFY